MGALDYRTAQGSAPVQPSSDSLGATIQQTQSHLIEIENRLVGLINRVEPTPQPNSTLNAKVEQPGILSAANILRNMAVRITDLVGRLETII